MSLITPNAAEVAVLKYIVGFTTTTEPLDYRLYVNNITPSETDTAASYTEAAGGGYGVKALAGASWTFTPGDPSNASYAQQTWTFTGALTGTTTIYGYYVTRHTTDDLMFAEAGPSFAPANNNDTYKVTPGITAS